MRGSATRRAPTIPTRMRCAVCRATTPGQPPHFAGPEDCRVFASVIQLLLGCRNMSLLPMNMTRGCPCTPEVMCALENGYNGVINPKACGPPRYSQPNFARQYCRSTHLSRLEQYWNVGGRSPGRPYSMHGGSGALFSIGLLRNVAFEDLEECVLSQWNTGDQRRSESSCVHVCFCGQLKQVFCGVGADAFLTICLWQVSSMPSQ